MNSFKTFLKYCSDPKIFKTSLKTGLIVGTLLALINHFDSIIGGTLTYIQLIQIIVTYFVPFSVATVGGASQAVRGCDN